MSNLTFKANHQIEFLQSIFTKLEKDQRFTCSTNEYDQFVWLELTISLTDTQVFSYLPRLVRMVWQHEECLHILEQRHAHKSDAFSVNKMTAVIVNKRRAIETDHEKSALRKRVAFLEQQFDSLSLQVFELMHELAEAKRSKVEQPLLSANPQEIIISDISAIQKPLAEMTAISETLIVR